VSVLYNSSEFLLIWFEFSFTVLPRRSSVFPQNFPAGWRLLTLQQSARWTRPLAVFRSRPAAWSPRADSRPAAGDIDAGTRLRPTWLTADWMSPRSAVRMARPPTNGQWRRRVELRSPDRWETSRRRKRAWEWVSKWSWTPHAPWAREAALLKFGAEVSSIRLGELKQGGGRYPPQNPPVTPKPRTPRRPTWRIAKSTLVPFMINIIWLTTSSRPCGPGGEAPAQGQHRTTLRWWRIIIICCWPPCRCHVRKGTKPYRSLQRTNGGALSASTWQSQVFVIANDHCLCLRRLFVVIANTSELNRRIELTPNRFVALFSQIYTKRWYCQVSQLTHIDVKVSALHRNLVGYD